VDLGPVVILPGLVNAHTHLELSYLKNEIAPASDFVSWIRHVMASRRKRPDPRAPEILGAIDQAVEECVASGTAVVGDISNTLVTFEPLARSPLAAVLFYELIRFNAPDADGLVATAWREIEALGATDPIRTSLAAHAPYSVAPLVFRAIRRTLEADPTLPCSVHLAESSAEVEFIRSGTGPWRQLLDELGAWDPEWLVPGVTPAQFLEEAGFLGPRVLAVHGVQMGKNDLQRLVAAGTCLVTCPRSNAYTGAGVPPIAEFYESSVRVAVGTDSLASCPDLNVFSELALMRALAPAVPASRLLESATIQGARALGFDRDFGTIDRGRAARLLLVDVPSDVDDVEEYLVSGIGPAQTRWIE
jgi:cytosine/adenosine deaminase-related metal-dependent hydrolase